MPEPNRQTGTGISIDISIDTGTDAGIDTCIATNTDTFSDAAARRRTAAPRVTPQPIDSVFQEIRRPCPTSAESLLAVDDPGVEAVRAFPSRAGRPRTVPLICRWWALCQARGARPLRRPCPSRSAGAGAS